MKYQRILALCLAVLLLLPAMPAGAEDMHTPGPEPTPEATPGWSGVISDPINTSDYHAVRFAANGQEVETVLVAHGETVHAMPDAPDISGQSFLGWYAGDALFSADTLITSDMTLTAKYVILDETLEQKKKNANYVFEDRGAYASISIFGNHKKNQVPSAHANPGVAGDENRIVLEAWTVDGIKNNTDLTAEAIITGLPSLNEGESLAVYSVIDNQLVRLIQDQLSIGDRVAVDLSMKGAKGIAVVKMASAPEEPVELRDDAVLWANDALYLTGKMPGNGVVQAVPVTVEIDGQEVLAAYDIKIFANAKQQEKGKTWQPAGKKVQVHFYNEAFASAALNVYHLADVSAAPEKVGVVEARDGWIEFEAESFSVYVISKTIEKTVSIGGATYKITVTYDSDAGIPDGAELEAVEVPSDAYLADAAAALNWTEEDTVFYTKFLDISIVKDGEVIEPKSPVDVRVELLDVQDGAEALEVVHFGDDGAEKLISQSSAEGVVTFSTDSFSTFGFGNVLRALLSWTQGAASYTLKGFSALLHPVYTAVQVELEEGLEAIDSYRISTNSLLGSLMKMWVKISADLEVSGRESIAVYSIDANGRALNLLKEETAGGDITVALENNEGFVLALDSGYRRKNIDLDGVTLEGMMPKLAQAEAADVAPQVANDYAELDNKEDTRILAAYQIDLTEEETEYQPDAQHPISVTLTVPGAMQEKELRLWHVRDGGAPEEITQFEVDGDTVRFDASDFSIYAVTGTIEKTVMASDGRNYHITVTYGPDAGVPEGADLTAEEIMYEEDTAVFNLYAGQASSALGRDATEGYIRLFDISIVDGEGQKVDLLAPVSVRIELADKEEEMDINVIHFADGSKTGDVLSNVKVESAEDTGVALSFAADGFSVYAIVDAPEPFHSESTPVKHLNELAEGDAYYLSYNGNHFFTNGLNNNSAFIETTSENLASSWYFEPAGESGKYYVYTIVDGAVKYITNPSGINAGLDSANKALFVLSEAEEGRFYFQLSGENKWLQHSKSGSGIRFYTDNSNAANSKIYITHVPSTMEKDPYDLDGKSFGIAYQDESVTAAAMMAEAVNNAQRLKGMDMLIRPDVLDNEGLLLVANNSDITEWTFENHHDDQYYISATVNGATKYLTITGNQVKLADTQAEATLITVVPGSGGNAGKWHFTVNGYSLNLNGSAANGFNAVNNSGATTWMNLVEKSVLDDDDFTMYSARKASVSDNDKIYDRTEDGVRERSQIIIYTRIWNDTTKRYEFYAVDHDGSLIRCYDTGDNIEWIGTKVNTALWNFTEYHNLDGTPNYYYELQNNQYQNYISPQLNGNQILSDTTIGLNLNGRRYGENYTTIIAWDEDSYAYTGLKVENGRVVPCPLSEADDFYFAVMDVYESEAPKLSTVATVDSNAYGISMKMIDYNNALTSGSSVRDSVQNAFFRGDNNNAGLLSTNLGEDGYPTSTQARTGHVDSLSSLYSGSSPVNHLFIRSIYNESGYFEYDSTQNFAHLESNGNFTVYDQLIATGKESGPTRTHGQFLPYNMINTEIVAPYTNQTSVLASPLPDTNPRKGETLYWTGVDGGGADYFFGMEMEASFTQTASGKDAWGHDIVFEFSGDDDFWLYVDGELVLDLGGVHPAMTGSINFRTGVVTSSRGNSTLYEIFKKNYQARGMSSSEINSKLQEIFERNENGQYVFKDYTNHTMKMFYMERGAGASNLHMRFNLAAVKPGSFLLSKTLSGTDNPDNGMLEFPYQIYYESKADGQWHLLSDRNAVKYEGTATNVTYKSSFTPAGGSDAYSHVFFLKPGQSAEITMPEDTVQYYVVECGINPDVYDRVTANGQTLSGTATQNKVGATARRDYAVGADTLERRSKVDYDNHVSDGAMRSMTITKRLYDTDGETILTYPEQKSLFTFRLYMGTENADPDNLPGADQYTYYIKDTQGKYCKWNRSTRQFDSLNISNYSDLAAYLETLSAAEKETIAFKTSMYGTISNIPAGYTVEVRDLIVGTQWKVEERSSELSKGYTRREADGYVRLDCDPTVKQSTPISGTMQVGDTPELQIRNQKGWGLTVEKIWTDKDFMPQHDPIYFAVYLPDVSGPLNGSVRQLNTGETELYYFFDDLKYIKDGDTDYTTFRFKDYIVREVQVTPPEGQSLTVDEEGRVQLTPGVTVVPIGPGSTLTNGGTPMGGTHQEGYKYTVSYSVGQSTGQNENIRTDQVTNSRPGISLYKTDMNGQNLAGAVFTLKNAAGEDVGAASYTSSADGLITRAYLSTGVYTLTEIETPTGFVALPGPITITVDQNQSVTVNGAAGMNSLYTLQDVPDEGMTATIIVHNRTNEFRVVKVDKDNQNAPLAGVHFALYPQVIDNNGNKRKDYRPMLSDLVTDQQGILPQVNFTDLRPGTYYLTETQTLDGYSKLTQDLILTIGANGTVEVDDNHTSWLRQTQSADGKLTFTVTIPNGRMKPMQLKKQVTGNMADFTKAFDFTISVTQDGENVPYIVGDEEKTADTNLSLAHNQSVTLYLPLGATVAITEDPDGYELKGASGATNGALTQQTYTFTVQEADSENTVTFINELTENLDTGVPVSGAPYAMLLGLGLLGLLAMILRRRKKIF